MNARLQGLIRIGVTDDLPEREARRIVFLNMLVFAHIPLFLLYVALVAAYLPTTWAILAIAIAHLAFFVLTLLWTYLRSYLIARIWFGVVTTFFITIEAALLGAEVRIHLFLVVCIFLMFYKFPADQRRWMYLLIGLYAVALIAIELLFRDQRLFQDLPPSLIIELYYVSSVGLVLSSIGLGAIGYIALSNAEERLAQENEIVKDKTRQLEIAHKYKSHFLASASHDLRQPLHALNLFVAQLRETRNPALRNRLIGRIEEAVGSMNELFGSLLDMAKLDAGILEPTSTAFPIARLFARIETIFAETARAKGIRFRIVSTSGWVQSDTILLERMLMNLVSNAVRYTQRGGVIVGCRKRGGLLRIDVCDTGPGIPDEQRDRVFGEFYQLVAPEADRRGSLGLGLAIVDRLGQLLDHRVELSSDPGRGSRFSISVPLASEGAMTESSRSPAMVADPARGKLVVVIDDDPLVLEGMGGILRSWGCKVVAGDTAAAVLAKIQDNSTVPDLIISDYRLEGDGTGIDAIAYLREAFRAEIAAFLISGDTAPERLRDASENGFHLLHKPVPPMRLRTMLNLVLRTHPRTRVATAAE